MKIMNDEHEPNADPPIINHVAEQDGNIINHDDPQSIFVRKVLQVINIVRDAQAYTPDVVATALDKVLDFLYMVCPLSPPPYGYEDRHPGRSLIGRSENSAGPTDSKMIKTSSFPQGSPMMGRVLDEIKATLDAMPNERASRKNTCTKIDSKGSAKSTATSSPCPDSRSTSEELENVFRWNFDMIYLERLSNRRPLTLTGMEILPAFDTLQILKIDADTLKRWLVLVENSYHYSNPYHNATHAADVMQATAYFLQTKRLKSLFDPIDSVIALLAAIIHDIDHPGKTNAFLINTRHELAILYNDKAVLESHHTAFAFKITLEDPKVNIFQNIDEETYQTIRASLVDMVSATEMIHHMNHVKNFEATLKAFRDDIASSTPDSAGMKTANMKVLKTKDNIIFTKRILIKCADVSNPARPLRISSEWVLRVCEEFFRQAEEEKNLGLPLTLPSFDRETCSVTTAQIGFNELFVQNLYGLWHEFTDIPEVIENLRSNYRFWKKMECKKICHLDELKEYFIISKIGVASLYTIT